MPEVDDLEPEHILALYQWSIGNCFNCARTDLPTTRITEVTPRGDGTYDVRACRWCTVELEAMRRQAARRRGQRYVPGQLGERRAG